MGWSLAVRLHALRSRGEGNKSGLPQSHCAMPSSALISQCGIDPEKRDVVTPVPCLPQLRVRRLGCRPMAVARKCMISNSLRASLHVTHRARSSGLLTLLACACMQVRMVACGGMHSLALTEDGEVWTWGEPWGDFSMKVERTPHRVCTCIHHIIPVGPGV